MPAELARIVPADIRELPGLLDAVAGFLETERFMADDIVAVQIAVDEAFSNIVMHGYRGEKGDIHLLCTVSRGEISIRLEDGAPPFDPTTLPSPDLEGDLVHRKPGGIGFSLIRHFMDGISYENRGGRNILTMRIKGTIRG